MAGPYFEKRRGERSKKSVDREIRWKKTTWQATAAIWDELVQELSRVEGYIEKLLTKEDGGNLFKRHSTFLDVRHRIINQLTIYITFVVMWFEIMTTLNICNLHRLLSKLFHFISRSCW